MEVTVQKEEAKKARRDKQNKYRKDRRRKRRGFRGKQCHEILAESSVDFIADTTLVLICVLLNSRTRQVAYVAEWELIYHEVLAISNCFGELTKSSSSSSDS